MNRGFIKNGYTLVELMVVIAIIALISSVVMVSLANARIKANDAKRLTDLKQLQGALELYYSQNNSYPSTGAPGVFFGNTQQASIGGNTTAWIPGISSIQQTLPQDPQYSNASCLNGGSAYLYASDGVNYKIIDSCPQNSEVGSLPPSNPFYDPVRAGSSPFAFMITNKRDMPPGGCPNPDISNPNYANFPICW